MDLKQLQNGSDIRGIALGDSKNLTKEAVEQLADAFVGWLQDRTGKDEVVVAAGRDSRVTGPELLQAAVNGLRDAGACVFDCGLASTPAMFMTTVSPEVEADGAIMITASHLPMDRNGMKFFTMKGGLEKEDIAQIIKRAQDGNVPHAEELGKVKTVDFMARYAEGLVRLVRDATGEERPLEGVSIVVDAGNGAGGFYAYDVLTPLGADVSASQFLEPDGTFPNHIPNPENKEAMESIVQAVKDADADFGIIFDTDVDRAGAVDKGGAVLNRDRLIAAISAILLKEHPGTTIVTDSITSTGLAEFIEKLGGKHHRFKRGYRNVINESIRLNDEGVDSQLAIETSGHAALKQNYFLDDGAYLVTQLIIELSRLRKDSKSISDLIADLRDPYESFEFRLPILEKNFRFFGQKIIDAIKEHYEHVGDESILIAPNNYEGVRVTFGKDAGDGWFLLRLSLHEPLLPLNIESDSAGGVQKIATGLYDVLSGFSEIDTSSLAAFVGK